MHASQLKSLCVDADHANPLQDADFMDFVRVAPAILTNLWKLELLVPRVRHAIDIWHAIKDLYLPALRTIIISAVYNEDMLQVEDFWERHPLIERIECSGAFTDVRQGILPNLRCLAVRLRPR
jgi:hypothetical protein